MRIAVNLKKNYKAFISYSHSDARWGAWLHNALESYRTPKRLQREVSLHGAVPATLSPIFRDQEELASAYDLTKSIRNALEQSESLVVICSPEAARSRWVNREIEYFKQLGRSERIFCLIVAGDPTAINSAADCFPPMLRKSFDANGQPTEAVVEPVAADVRPHADGKRLARQKIIAGLLGVSLDELRRREQHRRNRRLVAATAGSLGVSVITLLLAINATLARNQAQQRQQQAEELLTFMVGDLRDSLQPLGRLDLLESVGQQAQEYFRTVAVDSLTETELLRQAEVLTQLGTIRFEQLQYAEALSAFTDAYERTAALLQAQPTDGERLFNRSQAEFWIGFVAFRSGNMQVAEDWLTRYRDSTLALHELDPARDDWLLEVSYGHHNLATAQLEYGNLEEAARGFALEIEIIEQLISRNQDPVLMGDKADATSWLAEVALRRGNLEQALNYYQLSEDLMREAYEADARNANRLDDIAYAMLLVANTQASLGQLDQAVAHIRSAEEIFNTLIELDSNNLNWQRGKITSLVDSGFFHLNIGERQLAAENNQAADVMLNALEQDRRTDHNIRQLIARNELLKALLLAEEGDLDLAIERIEVGLSALTAIEALQLLTNEQAGLKAFLLSTQAQFHLTLNRSGAAGLLQEAGELLESRVETSRAPFLLDPWLRVVTLQRRTEQVDEISGLLAASRYTPLVRWPESGY